MTSYPGAHSLLTANHRLESWVYADATARSAATGFTVDDIGRIAFQQSDNTYWRLTDDSPVTWIIATGGVSSADLTAHAGIDSTQTVKGHTSWEMIQDMLNSALVAGSGITIVYDDVSNTFTFHGIALLEDLTTSLVDGSIPVAETGGLVNNPDLAYDAANNRVNIGPAVGGGTLSVKHVVAADGGNAALDLENAYTNPTQPTSQYGQWTQVTGANDTNVAAHLHAAGGTHNFALITDGGIVGIGVANPVQKLEVGGNVKLIAGDVQLDSGRLVDGVDVSTLPGLIAANNPMTTPNDLIVGGTSGAATRFAKGADGQVLTVDPTTHALVWATPAAGFTNPMSTSGDIIYGGSAGAATRLGKGSDNDILSLASGIPAWINRGLAALQNPMTGAGDLIVGSGSSTLVNLNLAAQGASMSSPNGNTAGHDPSKVIDGDDVTYWESSTTPVHPANIVADLGQARTISQFRLVQATGSGPNYSNYKIQSSPDNVTWTDRIGAQGAVDTGVIALSTSATTRYWRAITTAGNTAGWFVYTFELWGTPAIGQAIRLPLGPDTTVLGAMNGAPTWLARQAQAPMQSPMSAAGDLIYARGSTLINLATTALGAAFNASGALVAHPLADAFDGNDSTYWDAAVNPNANGWLSVDLGIARAVTNFRILQNGGGSDHYSNNFKLQSSTDGFTWTDRNTGISGVMDTGVIAVTGGPITARYWRAYSVSGNTLAWEIYSFELWGAGTGVPARLAVGSNGDVLTLASGLPTWAAPSGGGSAVYPTHATFWHDEAAVITGNALALSHDTNQNYAWFDMQNAPANGDVFEQTFTLAAGTYVFSVLGLTANSRGRLDWTVDGVNIVALEDWYSGGLTYNVIKVHTGIVIATSGLHTLRATVNGKNASSSGYEMLLTKYWFR